LTRANDLKQLAINIETAIEQTRRLNLPTSTYILSMVFLEVSQALKDTDAETKEDDAAP
jgi:hypothetical protein